MAAPDLKKYRPHLIVLFLVFFMLTAFILRILPALVTKDQAFFPVYDTDTWYTMRQIEVMVHNFPQYNWFDPMTAYPAGKVIDWGPLYPFLAAVLCLLTGSASQSAIISTADFVSPLLAVVMIPLMYGLGKKLGDRKTGIVAAGLVCVTSLFYFSYSSYGMVDHHVTEVFFSTFFFLIYLWTLYYAERNCVEIRNRKTLLPVCVLSAFAGVIYFLGLVTSTTLVLTVLVVAVYTFVQGLADFYSGKHSDYLLILNSMLFGVATALLALFGLKAEGISFSQYSIGIVYLHLAIIAETVVIWILAEIFRKKRAGFFISIGGLAAGGLILIQIIPAMRSIRHQAMDLLFGLSIYTVGVQETLPWSWASAFDTLNVGIILAAGGFLVLGYNLWKKPEREHIFFAVWSVLMLLITIQHQRFLYYSTVNIVLLIAICIVEPFRWENSRIGRCIHDVFSGNGEQCRTGPPGEKTPVKGKTGKKRKLDAAPESSRSSGIYLADFCIIAICLLAVVHVAVSFQQDYLYGTGAKEQEIPADWIESLGWLKANTPDSGIDYFGQYERKSYTPPPDSYGIMAEWDAGHWITFFARRPPITNPFQDNIGGSRGTAAFFLAENESEADGILEAFRGRYIITDSAMAVDRFTNLVPWQSGSVDISRYIKWFLIPDMQDSSYLKKTHLYDDAYFQTMVVKLHNFDGSMTEPTTAEYTRYEIRLPTSRETAEATGYSRVITSEKTVNVTQLDNTTPIIPEGEELLPTAYAVLYSSLPFRPLQTVPALRHYRLIHESADNASATMFPESDPITLPGIKMVKVFEYVKGAHISGTGIIELPLVTNTGRTYTYRQESIAGEFIVPYATTGNLSEVHATGPYHVAGTDEYIDVSENDVTAGKIVQGSQ